jgi:hypothetical protein
VQGDESLQSRFFLDDAVILAKKPVEKFRGGPRDRSEDIHEDQDQQGQIGADRETVAGADRLRDNLAEDNCKADSAVKNRSVIELMPRLTNQHRTTQYCRPSITAAQRPVQNDGQSLVGDDIAKDPSDQHPVLPSFQKSEDSASVPSLSSLARCRNNPRMDRVLAHEPKGNG